MTTGSYELLDMTINDIIRERPKTVEVFTRLGIDSCCGGALRLEEVLRKHKLDQSIVLDALERA